MSINQSQNNQNQIKLNDGEYIKIRYSVYKKETARYMIIRKYLPSREPDEIKELGFGYPKDRRITLFRYDDDSFYLIEFLTEFWLVHNNRRDIQQIMDNVFTAVSDGVSVLFKNNTYDYTEDNDDSISFIGFAKDNIYDGKYEINVLFNGKQYDIGTNVILNGFTAESETPLIKAVIDSDDFMFILREYIEAIFKVNSEIYVRD